jgi:hypothetical protein
VDKNDAIVAGLDTLAQMSARNVPPRVRADFIVRALDLAGYAIVPKVLTKPLSWNRTSPLPEGVDFKSEALEKLREQITLEMISFEITNGGNERSPDIHRAILCVQQ